MKPYPLLLIIYLLIHHSTTSQQIEALPASLKNGISKSNILSAHPFGIFISRLQGNFNTRPTDRIAIDLSLESANIWSAPVTGYIPNSIELRNAVSQVVWHKREFLFDVNTIDAQEIFIANDGVLKGFKVQLAIPINKTQELQFRMRSFLLTKGKFPFSTLTGDQYIEWFHDHIAGGEDPFARRLFGLDNAGIRYKDYNGNELSIDAGDLFIGGLETSYYYYPEFSKLKNKNWHLNFGVHLGTNLSEYNMSIDLGLSSNIIKSYRLNDTNTLIAAAGLGVLRKNSIELQRDNMVFGTNDFIGHLEAAVEFNFTSKGKTNHAFGMDFYFQTSYNKKDEFDHIIPVRNGVSEKAWITGLEHLYKNNNYWTFMYTFTRKVSTSFYLQQDFTLNNNPDIQTGISMSFFLK